MASDFQADIDAVGRIAAVPTILDVVCRTTGMGFAAIARVTEDRWIACSVKDDIAFGLAPGAELDVRTTICDEIRQHRESVIIDNVSEDERYSSHCTPAQYRFQSYISMPIVLPDGTFFGTLCAIDPRPAKLKNPGVIGMFRLFAELIAFHLDAIEKVKAGEARLISEIEASAIREQFIAVLGHDLRSPLAAIGSGMHLLQGEPLTPRGRGVVGLVNNTVTRMADLIENIMDFARGRLGGGIKVERSSAVALGPVLEQVVAEVRSSHADRAINAEFNLTLPVECDPSRVSQLLSNLLGNAVMYGAPDQPIIVRASTANDLLEISVANAGEPIAPVAMARLFSPFQRGEVLPSQRGLGLGLYIAAEVAKAHGGRLEVTSTPAETRFTFRMPLSS